MPGLDEIFLGLDSNYLVENTEIADIAEQFILSQNNLFINLGDDVDLILSYLQEANYYLIYRNYVIKGKKKIFKGKILKATYEEIIFFIKNITSDIDREYIISPVRDRFTYSFMISEDGQILFFGTL